MDSSIARRPLPLPEPSMGLEAYRDERRACLSMDERKSENWTLYQTASKRTAEVPYRPVRLDIENVSRCNFACTMCAVSTWNKRQRAADMPLHEFKALIDAEYGLVEIKLNGLGEALMQGDAYFDMIRYARSRRIWVRMTTNASLLHLRGNAVKLVESDVNEVDISVDGADEATYERIRVGGNFRVVTENCRLLNNTFRKRGMAPRTKMWTLVQFANYSRLEEHVALARDLGFRHVVFSLGLHGWGDKRLAARNADEQVSMDTLTDRRLWRLVEQGEQEGVRVSFWDVNDKFDTSHPSKLCPWPFERSVVTSDLRTTPCCMIGNPDQFEIGRGRGQSFTDLWHGPDYQAFRQAHLDGRIPDVCKGCYK